MKYLFIWLWGFLTYWALNYSQNYDGYSLMILPAYILLVSSTIFIVLVVVGSIINSWDMI